MNIITFDYTKANGTITQRVVSPVVVPNNMYEGTDLSELSVQDQVLYCQALGNLKDQFKAQVAQLQADFDVNNRYRRFDPSKMTNIIEEAV